MKKTLFTFALCLLTLNANAQTKEHTTASNVEWFNQTTKQVWVSYAIKYQTRAWDSYQTANAPKVYVVCYDPAADTTSGRGFAAQEKSDVFNNLLRFANHSCKPYELSTIVAFQK